MDLFALEIGMDPVDVRRKNLLPKFDEPHTTPMGQTYDCGDYEAQPRSGARSTPATPRCAPSRSGAATPATPSCSGSASASTSRSPAACAPMNEAAKIEIHPDGTGTIYTGTSPHGQGHDTVWSSIASAQTGIDINRLHARVGRHRPHAGRRRHDGLAVAAAGRRRRPRCGRSVSSRRPRGRRPPARGRRRRRRARRRRRCRSTSPARRPSPRPGPSSAPRPTPVS